MDQHGRASSSQRRPLIRKSAASHSFSRLFIVLIIFTLSAKCGNSRYSYPTSSARMMQRKVHHFLFSDILDFCPIFKSWSLIQKVHKIEIKGFCVKEIE